MPNFLVGADPEMFLKNEAGEFISAHDILPGTKTEPFPVPSGAIQVDGVAAEFNIDPAGTGKQFVTNISQVLTSLQGHAKGMTLTVQPYAVFDKKYFDALPEEVKELGCNPDYNAWTGQVNPSPDATGSMRTASGHIHIGWGSGINPYDELHFKDCRLFVKQLDYYLGLYSLVWDKDNTRRQMYGKAGAFRPKPYGVEYRVLSNLWLKSPLIQTWIFSAIQHAKDAMLDGSYVAEKKHGDFAQKCIDGNITDWWCSGEGSNVHSEIGMSFPDIRQMAEK